MKTIKITELQIKKPENIEIIFALLSRGNDHGIIIKCTGDYGMGSVGNDNGNYIGSMTIAALHRWRTRFLVFDFSELKYEYSDSLAGISHAIKNNRSPNYLVYIIVSDNCRKGVLSLVSYAKGIFNPIIISTIDEIWSAQQGVAPEPVKHQ